ncbi:MAG: hypothetical protein FWE44_03230 [Defluviitaleaceae bacterium]|nr:hypothetical protein [Defluviitaleaceae bacterium]
MNTKIREAVMLHKDLVLPPYDEIIDLNGIDAIAAFSRAFSGSSVYVPSLKSIFKDCIDTEIHTQYNGKKIRSLAKDYGLSERYIRNLVKDLSLLV